MIEQRNEPNFLAEDYIPKILLRNLNASPLSQAESNVSESFTDLLLSIIRFTDEIFELALTHLTSSHHHHPPTRFAH